MMIQDLMYLNINSYRVNIFSVMPQTQFSIIYSILSDSKYQTAAELSNILKAKNINLSEKQIYDAIYRNRLKDYLIDVNFYEKPYRYKKIV